MAPNFLPAFSAVLLVSVLACPAAASEPALVNVILKFEDSTGTIERTLPADSLGTNLGWLVGSARALPVTHNLDSVLAFWGGLYSKRGVAACGCHAPVDSLILVFSDGRREAYVMHCSNIYREAPSRSEQLGLNEMQRTQLSRRWDLVRERYCPKGYGCSDGKPIDRWDVHMDRKMQEGWAEERFDLTSQRIRDVLSRVLEESQADFPEMTLILSVRIKDLQVTEAAVDSVAPAHRKLAEEVVRRVRKLGKSEWGRDGSMTLRAQAWNYRREK